MKLKEVTLISNGKGKCYHSKLSHAQLCLLSPVAEICSDINFCSKKGNTLNSDNEAKSEYETELERLRAEVASLKSDLATCQSQSAFSDDFDPVL